MWNSLTTGEKLTWKIIGANVAVFAMWRFLPQPTMLRWFASGLKHPLPSMLLSTFSHHTFLHLFVNMYVLKSFAPIIANVYGGEQFLAVYLSGGMMGAFASLVIKRLMGVPYVSVGASGAIMTLLAVTGFTYPNAQFSIAFVSEIFPHSFSAKHAIVGLICFDVLGLCLGWRMIDHAGHLGGMLFGLFYAKYGHKLIWGKRESVMQAWNSIRGKPKSGP